MTLVGAALISLGAMMRADQSALWPLLWTALVTGVAETVGVRTGLPFGRYQYLPAAGPTLPGGLPIAIPAAWLILILPAVAGVERLWSARRQGRAAGNWLAKASVAALLMVAFDLVLDPIAVHRLRMWRWPEGGLYYGVPASNYLGWFCYSLLAALPFFHRRRAIAVPWPVWAVAASIQLFMACLGLRHGLGWPVLLGWIQGALLGWLAWQGSRLEGR